MRLERHGPDDWVAVWGPDRPESVPSYGYWLLVGPAAPGASATTIWSVVMMRPRRVGDRRLLRHELYHVRQWHSFGFAGFLVRYLGTYLRCRLRGYPHWAAYRRIPFEIEAEWHARRGGAGRPA
jgi:uncharacterized protein DUF4157